MYIYIYIYTHIHIHISTYTHISIAQPLIISRAAANSLPAGVTLYMFVLLLYGFVLYVYLYCIVLYRIVFVWIQLYCIIVLCGICSQQPARRCDAVHAEVSLGPALGLTRARQTPQGNPGKGSSVGGPPDIV